MSAKNKFLYLLNLGGFFYAWLIVFRWLFLIINIHKSAELGISGMLETMAHGWRMDMSVLGYLLLVPSVAMVAGGHGQRYLTGLLRGYIVATLGAMAWITISDAGMYPHWGYRLDSGILFYLKSPKSALASVDVWELLAGAMVWAGIVWGGRWLYRRWVEPHLTTAPPAAWRATHTGFALIAASMIIPIRGGLQQIPMGLSHAYYSNIPFANHAALSVFWNFANSFAQRGRISNQYESLPPDEANNIFEKLYAPVAAAPRSLLRTPRPNLIVIILEGFTSNLIGSLGGEQGICQNIDSLTREGILFTNAYASGDRTDKGLSAVLSGYPALPLGTILAYPQKNQSLPSLIRDFGQRGYQTSFYYGGELEFAGMKAYLLGQGIEKTIEKSDFPPTAHDTKWGAFDHVVLERVLADLNAGYNPQKPFFTTVLTLSSHEPFDVPMATVIAGESDSAKFKNSVVYSDSALGAFIREAKKSAWWDSTLVVLVADHGHRLPKNLAMHSLGKFKIPILWLGGALAVRDTQITTITQQTDIVAMVNAQYGWDYSAYKFSKDATNPKSRGFAFYTFNDGWGWVGDDSTFAIMDNISQRFIEYGGTDTAQLRKYGNAHLQVLSRDCIER